MIPPSEVEGRDLLRSVAAFQRELLRKRREREQTKVEMTTRGSCVAPGKGQPPWGPPPATPRSPARPLRLQPQPYPDSQWPRQGRVEGLPARGPGLPSSSTLFPQSCRWSWGAPRQPLKMTRCGALAQCLGGLSGT